MKSRTEWTGDCHAPNVKTGRQIGVLSTRSGNGRLTLLRQKKREWRTADNNAANAYMPNGRPCEMLLSSDVVRDSMRRLCAAEIISSAEGRKHSAERNAADRERANTDREGRRRGCWRAKSPSLAFEETFRTRLERSATAVSPFYNKTHINIEWKSRMQ
jgi:hypothetical protein